MALFEGREFEGRVPVDGHQFVACTFEKVALVYSGGPPPSFRGCIFRDWRFTFEGPAANTVNFLRAMAPKTSGLSDVIRQTFPDLAGEG